MSEQYIRIYARDLINTIGFLRYSKDKAWIEKGLEFHNSGYNDEEIVGGDFVVFKIVDKEKFVFTCLEYDLQFEPYNIYRSFTCQTVGK